MLSPLFDEALSLVLFVWSGASSAAALGSSFIYRPSSFITWLCCQNQSLKAAFDSMMELLYLFFWFSLTFAQSPVVNLGYASYQGRSLPNGVSQWLGMRFAAPPVGDLRFAAPQDPPTQQGVQKANHVCVGIYGKRASERASQPANGYMCVADNYYSMASYAFQSQIV